MRFCDQLAALRRRAELTQGELAEQLDVSRQAVSKWETGESTPDLAKLMQLAQVLGVSLDELCARPGPKEQEQPDAGEKPADPQAAGQSEKRGGSGKKRTMLRVLVIVAALLAGGIAGYLLGRAGTGQGGTASKKIPDNLRADSVQLQADEYYLYCFFYINYYSDTASFQVRLTDDQQHVYRDVPVVERDGECKIWIPIDTFYPDAIAKLEITVTEGKADKTVDVAWDIVVTREDGAEDRLVSWQPGERQ